jgi:L-serine dehydratase
MSHLFYSSRKLLELVAASEHKRISDIVLEGEKELTGHTSEEIFENMRKRLRIMRESIEFTLQNPTTSKSGMIGGEASIMRDAKGKKLFMSEIMRKATQYALAAMETNACMGRIVAAPTAGSAGILPGAFWAIQECWEVPEDDIIRGLLTASGIGIVIASISTFSAAAAGCQAEIGASSAMAAAGISEIRGMSPEKCVNSAAIALKNMLGLACDPIAGLVEVPCVKRNAIGVVHAMTASDMSFAGIKSIVPFDEVVAAMNNIAKNMHENIRETSKGGLAMSKTCRKIASRILNAK